MVYKYFVRKNLPLFEVDGVAAKIFELYLLAILIFIN